MSQHFKSNTDLSLHSNSNNLVFDEISRQESNASDASSASALLPNNITLMGLNHLQSSPLQQFVNPNINAPKLIIPPSKANRPSEITIGNDKHENVNNEDSKTNSEISKTDNIPHPITPATEISFNYQSPIPPNTDANAQIAEINQFIPQFWRCLQDLSSNVNAMQTQFSKLNSQNPKAQTGYRSQSNSSTNSLRTQTSIASSIAGTHGVYMSNSTNDSLYNRRRSLFNNSTVSNIPGAVNINEKTSARRNRKLSPQRNTKNKNIKKPTFLAANAHRNSISYNNYSQYRFGNKAPSPKGAKQYVLTADSLELLHISQKESEKQKMKTHRRQRNRSKSFAESKNKRKNIKRRNTLAVRKTNKSAFSDDDDDDYFDDEVSLYSTPNSMSQSQQGLAIIHSTNDQNKHILFEEGNIEKLSNKFHRKSKKDMHKSQRKPSSATNSNSSGHTSNQSQFSISSIAITDVSDNPQSPDSNPLKFNKAHFAKDTKANIRRASQGTHLYPTPKTNAHRTPKLTQSHSESNIHATATVTEKHSPTTPWNTPNVSAVRSGGNITAYDIIDNNNKRRSSLTPPQEDKEVNDYELEPLIIIDDDEMIINGDKVQELPVYSGGKTQTNIVFTTNLLPLTKYESGQNGEDSVSISMNSVGSRPQSTKLNKNVHFDVSALQKVSSMEDIEESKNAEYRIDNNKNLLPSQVKNHKKRGRNGKNERISKLKNELNGKNRRRNLRKLKLSQQNLRVHNGLNQIKNKLICANLEKKDVSAMTNEQLNEMLVYINRMQWLILDEKAKRECCVVCNAAASVFAVLLPCAHQSVCYNCSTNVKQCPICNKTVEQSILPRRN